MVVRRRHHGLPTYTVNATTRQRREGQRRCAGWLELTATLASLTCTLVGSELRLTTLAATGSLAWTNAPVPGICTLEWTGAVGDDWTVGPNLYLTTSVGGFAVPVTAGSEFFRLGAVGIPPTRAGFTNLVEAYGLLETIAGNGAGQTDGVSYWQAWFEGWPGSWASLSRPHFAMSDRAGSIYIADKNSHSILRVSTDGLIHTQAGTHVGGFNGEGPSVATNLQLNLPNGLWVRADGTVYVLDTGNGRVRRIDTNGVMTTLFLVTANGSSLAGGRGLWVKDDESLAYFCAETRLRSWSAAAGLGTVASGFSELGTLCVDTNGDILLCDRGAHRVYHITPGGTRTILAGNGTASGGGDGGEALATGLNGVRSIWPVPTGGYLLLTHDGCQLWYLDTAGSVHLLLNGDGGRTHDGDGLYFYSAEPKISEGRSVTMDYGGNIILCESDYGYIRRIRFQRMPVVAP